MYQIVNFKKNDFYITSDSSKLDMEAVCSLLSNSYWASSRPKNVIIKSLENSLCFSLFYKEKQVGLVRVITDGATFAYLCDVIIDEKYRHSKLGTWLLECVLSHPDLQNLKRFFLATRDAHGFYRKFGFHSLKNPEKFMEGIYE